MRFAKTAAAACTVATALVITAATAHAEPAAPPDTVAATVSGVDHGIGYQITVSPVDEAVIATVGTGRFGFGPGGAVLLQTDGGTALAEVPLSYAAEGRTIALTPHIDAAGHTLTLTASATAADIAEGPGTTSFQRLAQQIDKNLPGVVGGAVVGGLLGACLVLIWGISIPAGVLIGGTIGGYVSGGPEFLDAVTAFVTGRP
ncbi:MAG TPA: hypothetical protein VK083_09295 [Nocardia sp.]|uniref:hypothetical protein n=1 Tax=Nocardia TaxID=1817 RepID=UPI0024552EF2|nr:MULTISPECIES: hypothetical protein [Nocardia]HLS76970.1 hypothetical protein [Nocardia sp.]